MLLAPSSQVHSLYSKIFQNLLVQDQSSEGEPIKSNALKKLELY